LLRGNLKSQICCLFINVSAEKILFAFILVKLSPPAGNEGRFVTRGQTERSGFFFEKTGGRGEFSILHVFDSKNKWLFAVGAQANKQLQTNSDTQ
jgi:hypothetical protein